MSNIIHHPSSCRFETTIEGHTAHLSYVEDGDTLNYHHTFVPTALGGQGIGKALVQHALEYARTQHKKVVPSCSFVAAFIDKNPQYQDLLA